jgi:hypothetical protein
MALPAVRPRQVRSSACMPPHMHMFVGDPWSVPSLVYSLEAGAVAQKHRKQSLVCIDIGYQVQVAQVVPCFFDVCKRML